MLKGKINFKLTKINAKQLINDPHFRHREYRDITKKDGG